MKYRKKPVVVDAYKTDQEMFIQTLEGTMRANPGDWIITGVHGERYPCKPDIFAETYEPINEDEDNKRKVKGRWVEKRGPKFSEDKNFKLRGEYGIVGYTCSVCGRFEKEKEPFCNCGADMRPEKGEVKNENN